MFIKFDLTLLEPEENVMLEVISQQITPLCVNPGKIVLTSLYVYFQPINNDEMVKSFVNNMQYLFYNILFR